MTKPETINKYLDFLKVIYRKSSNGYCCTTPLSELLKNAGISSQIGTLLRREKYIVKASSPTRGFKWVKREPDIRLAQYLIRWNKEVQDEYKVRCVISKSKNLLKADIDRDKNFFRKNPNVKHIKEHAQLNLDNTIYIKPPKLPKRIPTVDEYMIELIKTANHSKYDIDPPIDWRIFDTMVNKAVKKVSDVYQSYGTPISFKSSCKKYTDMNYVGFYGIAKQSILEFLEQPQYSQFDYIKKWYLKS